MPCLSPSATALAIPIQSTLFLRTAIKRAPRVITHPARPAAGAPTPKLALHSTHASYLTLRTRLLHTSAVAMSDSSATKTESEWRAVLTPQQVRPNRCRPTILIALAADRLPTSSASCARRAPSLQAPASTTSTTTRACTHVRAAARRCTRARPSSRAAAAGRPSSTVSRVF